VLKSVTVARSGCLSFYAKICTWSRYRGKLTNRANGGVATEYCFCLGVRQKLRDKTTHPPHEKSLLTFLFPNIVSLSTQPFQISTYWIGINEQWLAHLWTPTAIKSDCYISLQLYVRAMRSAAVLQLPRSTSQTTKHSPMYGAIPKMFDRCLSTDTRNGSCESNSALTLKASTYKKMQILAQLSKNHIGEGKTMRPVIPVMN
jgi:hypothetical protein